MASDGQSKGWLRRGWDDVRPNLLWWLIQVIFGSGLVSGAYAVLKTVANESVSLLWVLLLFFGSCVVFFPVSLFIRSQQDKRYRKSKGVLTAMVVYMPILLGVAFCVWAYLVGTTLYRIDRETHALRSNLDLYYKPRTLSEDQSATLAAVLSKTDSQDVAVVVHANDAEASNYMGQIVSGLYRGGWKMNRTAYTAEQMNPGISINVEYTGQPVNPDPKHPRPDEILKRAFDEAKITVNGGGGSYNRPAYTVTITIGPRPMIMDSAAPPPRPQVPPPPGWQ
jgi:hypothetical protein